MHVATKHEAREILDELERDSNSQLYRCRYDAERVAIIVPQILSCLAIDDTVIVHRALCALHLIGRDAHLAIQAVTKFVFHHDKVIRDVAVLTLARISIRYPQRAIKPLVFAASEPETQKLALFALIDLGPNAISAVSVFVSAFESRDARIRRLALRGLKVIGADKATVEPLIKSARNDSNGLVRDTAEKLARSFETRRV